MDIVSNISNLLDDPNLDLSPAQNVSYETIGLSSYDNQPQYNYDNVMLSVIKNLNTRILNQSFTKLVKNDIDIFPINNYIPNIWENKWFNDDSIGGYQTGDVVWKGVMTFNSFLSNYAGLIQDYANSNKKLERYFKYSPSEYYEEIQKYQNIVSGYSAKISQTEYKQILPMLFDPGNLTQTTGTTTDTVISIYISLKDDNKAYLSDENSWKMIVLKSTESYNEYISSEISIMFDKHLQDYHLGGLTLSSEFDQVLLRKDFSNFDKDDLYGTIHVNNHYKYVNSQGVDYVIKFEKAPVYWSLSSTYTLYRWFRLWNSGYLEHGGYVEFPSIKKVKTNQVSDYTATVNLEWSYDDGRISISSLAYDYPTMSNNLYGDMHKLLYFRDGVEQVVDNDERVLRKDKRYSVCLTPVDFLSSYLYSDNELSGKYKNISALTKDDFLTPQYNNSINYPYLNVEIHNIGNRSFDVTRSIIDDGQLSNSHVNLMQYYVSGYRSSITRSYNLADCTVVGLNKAYAYTGEPVEPMPALKANDGMTLVPNVDYYVTYSNNVEFTSDESNPATIEFHGYDPWRGSILRTFLIKKTIFGGKIIGLEQAYEYGRG